MRFHRNLYRFSQLYRQLDEAERREARRRGADALRLLRLKSLKFAVRRRLTALITRPAHAR